MIKTKKHETLNASDPNDNGLIDGNVNVGRPIVSFSFSPTPTVLAQPAAPPMPVAAAKGTAFSFGRMSFNTSTRGSTPTVDEENYTIKRCYQFSLLTLRKLNELKANHSDVNVYLNTIIDKAISHYHEHVFNRRPTS